MCCRIFVFYNTKTDSYVYLNAPDNADKDKLLQLYVDWYNNDFIDNLDPANPIDFHDFKYESYHCPIDFYDDYKKAYDTYITDQVIK